jgi:hypothetical protein
MNIARVLTVAVLALGGTALGAVVATPASATVCYINGVRQPCPRPDYENDCEGVLRRPDCDQPTPPPTTEAPAPEPTQGDGGGQGGAPAKKAPKTAQPTSEGTHSTTTQTGQSVTTVTVDEASGTVTTVTEDALAYHARRGMARLGGDTA